MWSIVHLSTTQRELTKQNVPQNVSRYTFHEQELCQCQMMWSRGAKIIFLAPYSQIVNSMNCIQCFQDVLDLESRVFQHCENI